MVLLSCAIMWWSKSRIVVILCHFAICLVHDLLHLWDLWCKYPCISHHTLCWICFVFGWISQIILRNCPLIVYKLAYSLQWQSVYAFGHCIVFVCQSKFDDLVENTVLRIDGSMADGMRERMRYNFISTDGLWARIWKVTTGVCW